MKKLFRSLALVLAWLPAVLGAAVPLTESSFSQVINDVKVFEVSSKAVKPARVAEVFKTPDLLHTGADSLAELTAPDKTITRIGANTVFSFEPQGRSIYLKQGSVLFHSPKGKGGGTIKSGGASASVLGTTIMVSTTLEGGFKMIVLEGKGQLRLANGDFRIVKAGQLAFVLPGGKTFGPVLDVNLEKLVGGSRLVSGFGTKLASLDRILEAIGEQNKLIAQGRATDTGLLVGRSATRDKVQVFDASVLERVKAANPARLAKRTDSAGESDVLDPGRVFTGNVAPLPASPGGATGSSSGGAPGTPAVCPAPQNAQSYLAHNITIKTPTVDVTPYTGGTFDAFVMHAEDHLEIRNSTTFLGRAGSCFTLGLVADRGIRIADGSTIIADQVGDLALVSSGGELKFENVQFQNDRAVSISSEDKLEFKSKDAGAAGITASSIDLRSVNKELTVRDATLASPIVTLAAKEKLVLQNATLTGLSSIAMDARTINLQDVNFPGGSTVNLRSELGLLAPNPNSGRSSMPGHINFINGVAYNGALIPSTATVDSGGMIAGTGISIARRP